MAATLEAFGEQIAANAPAAAHRSARRHGRGRHLPVVAGRGLPDRRDHPGRRGHRHHPLVRRRPISQETSSKGEHRAVAPRGPPRRRRQGGRLRRRLPRPVPAGPGQVGREQAALVPAPVPRQRTGLHGGQHHRLPRRRGVGGAVRAVRVGDLAEWSAEVDAMRHASEGKIVRPGAVVAAAGDRLQHRARERRDPQELALHGGHGLALQGRPAGLPGQGGHALRPHAEQPEGGGHRMIELEAAFQPVLGTHQTTEVILWQRVVNTKAVMWMLGHDLPPEASGPGTWLHDALEVRDRWESRLLRSAAWSPLY